MAATYTPIATTTLGSDTTVTFSSIPQTYTDLVVVAQLGESGTNTNPIGMRFNSDSGTNYSVTEVYGDGTSALSQRFTNQTEAYPFQSITPGGNLNSMMMIHIMNYANTTTYKTAISRGNGAGYEGTTANVNLWRNTSAINTIFFRVYGTTNLRTGSTFTLYGILSA